MGSLDRPLDAPLDGDLSLDNSSWTFPRHPPLHSLFAGRKFPSMEEIPLLWLSVLQDFRIAFLDNSGKRRDDGFMGKVKH